MKISTASPWKLYIKAKSIRQFIPIILAVSSVNTTIIPDMINPHISLSGKLQYWYLGQGLFTLKRGIKVLPNTSVSHATTIKILPRIAGRIIGAMVFI